jgi:GNAT superfamily N-acetyltransferase
MAGDATTPNPPVDEGFLHSLATSLGVEPEQVKAAAKAIYEHPVATAEAVGGEAASETKDAVTHPLDTASQAVAGVRDAITNPQAQEAAKARLAAPGLKNKAEGAVEYLESGIPLVGGNIVKADEQGLAGNIKGELGTLAGTGAQVVTGGEEAAPEAAAKAATEGIDFSAAGGKKLTTEKAAPKVDIQAEGPDWDRTHSAYVDGKKVGSVGYKVDPDGRAQIYGSQVTPEMRGQGIGQALYKSALDEAPTKGANRITSDSTNTSPDANRVWEKLRDKGQPVENITHPNGKPGYQVDFEVPPEKAAVEHPPMQFEQALARRGELPGQKVNLSPAYGDSGKYVGGLNKTGNGLLQIPQDLLTDNGTTHGAISHEYAHAVVADAMGLPTEGAEIQSHLHPESAGTSMAAATKFDWTKIPGVKTVPGKPGILEFSDEALKDSWPKFVPTYLAGGVAEDLLHGLPIDENKGVAGDLGALHKIGKTLGYTSDEVNDMIKAGYQKATDILSHPATGDIIKQNSAIREEGLPNSLHASPEKVQDVLRQVREARNEEPPEGSRGTNGTVVSKTEPSAAGTDTQGTVRENNGKAVPNKLPATATVAPGTDYENPTLQKMADALGTSEDAAPVKKGASFLAPDGQFIHLPAGTFHDTAIDFYDTSKKYSGTPDNRVGFLNDSGAVRLRFSKDRGGDTLHVSIPKQGVTEEQIPALQRAIAQAGRNGNVVMERTDVNAENKDTATMSKEFPRAGDTEDYLRQIQAHPDQRGVSTPESKMTVSEAANSFNKEQGRGDIDVAPKKVSEAFAKRLADHFDTLKHEPDSPEVKKTYDALKSDIDKQWDYATNKMGMEFDPWTQKGQPYANSREMMEDVKDNHHLYFFQGGDIPNDHPMAAVDPQTGLKYMDKLRAIHDLFGHAAEGHQFGPTGEENAYLLHRQMFSPEAIPALTSETRAQNAWVNYGAHMRNANNEIIGKGEPGYVAAPDRPYAEQKAMMLAPEFNSATPGKGDEGIANSAMDIASTFGSTPFTANDIKLFTNSNDQAEINSTIDKLVDDGKLRPVDATHYRAVPSNGWSKTAAETAAAQPAGGLDPRTGQPDTKGLGTEIVPEARQALDHSPTQADFENFQAKHQDLLDKHPELRIGWDNTSNLPGGHEINLGAIGEGAARVAKKLDQRAAFDIGKQEEIPTAGVGLRSEFPNYSMEDRMKDLRNEPLSGIKNFEHLSKDVYDSLEPDERDYLQGNKTLQRNVMTQYHNLIPSVNETANAMQAGAALGGWWKRYIDIFHGLADDGAAAAKTIGPSHAEVLKQWHAALSANKSVEDANNLAWHTYADWLDAGKPLDRASIDKIVKSNGAQPAGNGKKGNAAMSDTYNKRGKLTNQGTDTTKIFNLVNSPEMKGERPFGGDVFREDAKNPLMGTTEGARKVPSMGATVAGAGNLNRLVIDSHIRDFFGRNSTGGPAAQYIADSAHLRQAAKMLGLKGGEGQEQLWGTVLGLKTLLKEGLTPADAAGTLNAEVINNIGKDYAEVIANDPEITRPGGVLDRLAEKHGIGRGAAGLSEAYRATSGSRASQSGPAGSQAPVSETELGKTAGRILGTISPTKIKALAPDDDSFAFGHNESAPDQATLFASEPKKKSKGKYNAMDLIAALGNLKKPAKK